MALAGLASATVTVACNKIGQDATEVPAAVTQESSSPVVASPPGEHACGNHAEGSCGATKADDAEAGDVATARDFDIAPGKFAEANFTMAKGTKITIVFDKGAPDTAWDVHSHDHSGGTTIHDQGQGGAGTVEFTAPEDGVFSILWKNTGDEATPLTVSIALDEGASIHSWIPAQ